MAVTPKAWACLAAALLILAAFPAVSAGVGEPPLSPPLPLFTATADSLEAEPEPINLAATLLLLAATGALDDNPLLKDMILGHMTRCNLVSPYGVTDPPVGTDPLSWWGERVVKWFWGETDPAAAADAVTFVVACTVGSIIGYLVQQFLIGRKSVV